MEKQPDSSITVLLSTEDLIIVFWILFDTSCRNSSLNLLLSCFTLPSSQNLCCTYSVGTAQMQTLHHRHVPHGDAGLSCSLGIVVVVPTKDTLTPSLFFCVAVISIKVNAAQHLLCSSSNIIRSVSAWVSVAIVFSTLKSQLVIWWCNCRMTETHTVQKKNGVGHCPVLFFHGHSVFENRVRVLFPGSAHGFTVTMLLHVLPVIHVHVKKCMNACVCAGFKLGFSCCPLIYKRTAELHFHQSL